MALTLSDVNRGSAPGDGTGETAYSAFGKVNTNNGLIETAVDTLAGRFWTTQNSSTTLALGGRYKANNHAGITLTLPAVFSQTAGTLSDIWVMNADDASIITLAPQAADTLYTEGTAYGAGETHELRPGTLAMVSPRTTNSEWDVLEFTLYPEGINIRSTGETGSTKALMTVGDGSCVWAVVLTPLDVPLNNFGASVAPTVNDDTNDGYTIGSRWIDYVNDREYVCVAASPAGSAVWKEVTNEQTGTLIINNFSATGAPTVNDDTNDGYEIGSRWINTVSDREYVCVDATAAAAIWQQVTNQAIQIEGVDVKSTGFSTSLRFLKEMGDGTCDFQYPQSYFMIEVGDENTAITTGTAKKTFRVPYQMFLEDIRASVKTAPTGANLIIDINLNGSTIMTTNKLRIDATEKTSVTSAAPHTLTTNYFESDDEITIDFDQVGSSVAGSGVKIWFYGYRTS